LAAVVTRTFPSKIR